MEEEDLERVCFYHLAYAGRGRGLASDDCTPAETRALGRALADQGWKTSGPLLPGFGADVETLPRRGVSDWMATLEAELSALQGGDAEQNAAIARFSAAAPPYRRSRSRPANWVAAKVGNTSWAAKPRASSTWGRPRSSSSSARRGG